MSFVDLSEYDKATTKATTAGIELVDNHSGNRGTLLVLNEDTNGLLIDFLMGRVDLKKISVKAEPDEEQIR